MILCRSHVLSGPQFLHLSSGAENACLVHLGGLLEEINEGFPLRGLGTCEGLWPLFLLYGPHIPKRGADSPGSLPGGRAPKPRLEREVGVSQLDIRRRGLQAEQTACAKAEG